jgi:serine/threonine-protein kinase
LALSVVEAGFERQLTPGETQTLAIPPLFSPTTSSAGLENVPGFDLVREIGRGGMGVVYEAVQQSNGQRVALKVIVPARTADERAIQFFLREASVLSQLNHKRIVQFHGLQMSAGRLILAMEYVPSVAHRDYLAAKKEAVRVRCYCGIICQVLDALRYAHARGIVHRDIKPSNILLTPDGRGLGAKVADFGLAKNFQDAGFSHLTGRGEQRGTVPFMPPEQVQDPCYAKPAADIYAAGATLYSYLAGRSPYVCSRSEDPWVVILELEPTPLQSLRPDLPPELTGLVHKALARRPEDRFASAREMYRALHPFAKGRAR